MVVYLISVLVIIKMKKKTRITAVLLTVVIALICASVFVACNKDSQSQGAKMLI